VENPTSAAEIMRITIGQMRAREKEAKKERDRKLTILKHELSNTTQRYLKF